ncbi:VOC family protein [Parapedobacter tibetensis]|uniref:VOC family protein n=1 Tax=Parapedobacter tibetensis TaxID=2972951 RepID=UPI00214D9B7C|nr:VOC family protein [Parapedobacter tibetensis]
MKDNNSNNIGFTGIDHPAVAADDVDQLADWYCEVLGYEKYFRHDKPVWMLRAPDDTLLEIMPKDHTVRPERTTWTPGWSHLAIRVANLDEAIARLDEKGVQWGGDPTPAIGGGRVRNLVDPEGNMLQILERQFEH